MKMPIQPKHKTKYFKLDKDLCEKIEGGCSLHDLVDACQKEDLDFKKVIIDLGFPTTTGFHVLENVTVEEDIKAWEEYGKKEKEYFEWVEENPEEASKQKVKDQIEELQEQLKEMEKE